MTTDTPDAAAVQAAIERCKQASSPREDDWDLLEDAQLLADACEHYQRELAAALERERGLREALEQYARIDYYHFLLDPIGQQTDPTAKARAALTATTDAKGGE